MTRQGTWLVPTFSEAALADVKVRQALNPAINCEQIAQAPLSKRLTYTPRPDGRVYPNRVLAGVSE